MNIADEKKTNNGAYFYIFLFESKNQIEQNEKIER